MTGRTWTILVTMVLAMAGGAGLAAADTYGLAGSGEALWLIRRHDQMFDLAAKPTNQNWQTISKDLRGDIAVFAVVDKDLHVLFRTGRDVIYDIYGRSLPGLSAQGVYRWPDGTAPLAVCQGSDFPGLHGPGLVAVVQRLAGPIPPAPDTRPATAPASVPARPAATSAPASDPHAQTAPATAITVVPVKRSADGSPLQMVNLAVYADAGSGWDYISEVPGVLLAPHHRVLCAAVSGTLYVLVAQGPDSQLLACKDKRWRPIPLPQEIQNSQVLAALSIHGRLALVAATRPAPAPASQPAPGPEADASASTRPATAPAPATPEPGTDFHAPRTIRLYTLAGGEGSFSHQTVRRNDQPMLWPEDSLPMAAVLAQQVVLVWKEGKALQSATCDLTGEVPAVQDIDVFQRAPYGDGLIVLSFFRYTLLAGVFLMMFFLRPRTVPKPFTLPPALMPSTIGSRVLAAMLDFAPFALLGGGLSLILLPAMNDAEFRQLLTEIMDEQAMPVGVALAFTGAMLSYLAYSILMEFYFGATLGKMLFRLRVVGEDGRRPEFREVLTRNLMKVFALSFTYLLLAIYVLFMLVTRNRQGLGDMVARTTVVVPRPPGQAQEEPPLDDF